MPGLNGTEAMRKIRALQPKVPIILISGDGDDRSPSPFTRFLPKPFTPQALASHVASLDAGPTPERFFES
jgi:CheY-like chemotaxis protein